MDFETLLDIEQKLETYGGIIELRKLAKLAALDMMEKVKIDGDHTYTRQSDGKWLAGVTSVSGMIPKEWLPAWGAKEAVKALGYSDYEGDTAVADEVRKAIAACTTTEEYIAILKDAKGAHARKKGEALLNGKEGHAWVEDYIKAKMRGEELPLLPEGMLARPLFKFIEWSDKTVAFWVLSEARVCDCEREYAGTLDAVAYLKDGRTAVVDCKFASHIDHEYALQTAAYQATLENYGIRIDTRIIVRLPKTLTRDEWNKEARKYEKVENDIEVREFGRDSYEWDRDVFYSALPVKKWVNEMKARNNF